eukprot:CAMPEP_0196130338 /NCGR_PEP_ID=MMETSP0910-20130528/751_1 /TAXON_ID=49265 /ORGANISM="Thalassiosira rotula, Strain GSO102" /LENGTH=100 /DNA_ID=CAMNT_0041389631 /DNA_START=140 /DNA_END=442 /DNA_ORIENTATION=-
MNSQCCGFYSATGVIFMTFVYVMLSTQPFFITGIDNVEEARSNAFGAMIMFCVTFAISAVLISKEQKSSTAREYDTGAEDHNLLNVDLKNNYGSVPTDSY